MQSHTAFIIHCLIAAFKTGMAEILTAVCLATVQDRAAQMAQRRSDSGLARRQRGGKADIRHKQFLCPGNYRAEVVSRSNVEPMGAGLCGCEWREDITRCNHSRHGWGELDQSCVSQWHSTCRIHSLRGQYVNCSVICQRIPKKSYFHHYWNSQIWRRYCQRYQVTLIQSLCTKGSPTLNKGKIRTASVETKMRRCSSFPSVPASV